MPPKAPPTCMHCSKPIEGERVEGTIAKKKVILHSECLDAYREANTPEPDCIECGKLCTGKFLRTDKGEALHNSCKKAYEQKQLPVCVQCNKTIPELKFYDTAEGPVHTKGKCYENYKAAHPGEAAK